MTWRAALLASFSWSAAAGCIIPPRGGLPPTPAVGGGAAATAAEAAAIPQTGGSPPHNLLANSTFDGGLSLPWTTSFTTPGEGRAAVVGGEFCLEVGHAGANPWDAQVRHREMVIERGHSYAIRFRARASRPTRARVKVGMAGPPYAEYWFETIALDPTPRAFTGSFSMRGRDDPTAELTFHVGGPLAAGGGTPFSVCIDEVALVDPLFVRRRGADADPIRTVLVNQVGYLPNAAKRATVKSAAKAPLAWRLRDVSGRVVAAGATRVHGMDPASGEHVHVADFSSFTTAGAGYTLEAGGETSHRFDIAPDAYRKLKYDALAYFYQNRSGIEIAMPYAGGKQWARPAGHLSDRSVLCAAGSGCGYTLDVSGGWYDAGDHGKYVVCGGISLWTMLNQYERAVHLGSSAGDFGDGKLAIPERGNRVPDILDEARWQMEWMLRMQVPAGQPRAGMAHHKVHDKEWTALGLAPHEDPMPRFLHAPSTAATLNLAATAAQCARIWRGSDAAFSVRCLGAAEHAWAAAKAHPGLFAPAQGVGGGPYDDTDVSDEIYWAAAELFITTGKAAYRDALSRSPHHRAVPHTLGRVADAGLSGTMTWQSTEALGTISLAVVPSTLPPAEVAAVRASVKAAADAFLRVIDGQGYGVPLKPGGKGEYPWGSNSFALNNMLVLALAHDFGGGARYLDGVVDGMGYILGRNPLDQSYVTGYGERPLRNPHHRFWAKQANARYPAAPPGAVSGGPNSGLHDPYVQAAALKGCAPQKCFVDHIEAWSTNEITINWNAPLAWIAAFLDEKGRAPEARSPR